MKLTNQHNLPLSIAIWLASDDYDGYGNEKTISVTSLLKPIKQLVLVRQNSSESKELDVMDLYNVRLGHALHDSIEKAWEVPKVFSTLELLDLPASMKRRMDINDQLIPIADPIKIKTEFRNTRTLGDWTISGKFDFFIDGQLEDFKTITVWGYLSKSNIPDYQMQGSMYRWLNPTIVTEPTIQINYFLKDWRKTETFKSHDYPKTPIQVKHYPLHSIEDTEMYIRNRLKLIERFMDAPEHQMPMCTDDELWRTPAVYKYYKKPGAARSTGNRDTMQEAVQLMTENGGVGEIIVKPGQVKRCIYCAALPFCKQKDSYLADGSLTIED